MFKLLFIFLSSPLNLVLFSVLCCFISVLEVATVLWPKDSDSDSDSDSEEEDKEERRRRKTKTKNIDGENSHCSSSTSAPSSSRVRVWAASWRHPEVNQCSGVGSSAGERPFISELTQGSRTEEEEVQEEMNLPESSVQFKYEELICNWRTHSWHTLSLSLSLSVPRWPFAVHLSSSPGFQRILLLRFLLWNHVGIKSLTPPPHLLSPAALKLLLLSCWFFRFRFITSCPTHIKAVMTPDLCHPEEPWGRCDVFTVSWNLHLFPVICAGVEPHPCLLIGSCGSLSWPHQSADWSADHRKLLVRQQVKAQLHHLHHLHQLHHLHHLHQLHQLHHLHVFFSTLSFCCI